MTEENLTEATATKKRLYRLKGREQYRLFEALKENASRFEAVQPTYEEAAEILAQELGFQISAGHVAGACLATGVTWKRKRKAPGGNRKHDRLRLLSQAVEDLMKVFNYPVPEYVYKLSRGQAVEGNGQAEGC